MFQRGYAEIGRLRFISGWNLLWPLKMFFDGGLGDKLIAVHFSHIENYLFGQTAE
jgi:hypothetical protein